MLKKAYRELHDGLGTVAIGLNLPKKIGKGYWVVIPNK